MGKVEGYRIRWGEQDLSSRKGLPIPGCPWTEAQLETVVLADQGKTHQEIAAIRHCAKETVGATLANARLAAFSDTEEPLPLRELIRSPRVQAWLKEYREKQNGQSI